MSDLRCTSVLGHDDAVHAINRNGFCLCGMGRKNLVDPDNKDAWRRIYGDWPVNCLECLARQDHLNAGVVWLHSGI